MGKGKKKPKEVDLFMRNLIQPATLVSGDSIAIVAPAGKVDKDYIHRFTAIAEEMGLNVILGKNLFCQHYQFAGTDAERLDDFQWALDNEKVKAVICARGGYGAIRLIEKLNWEQFKQQPKWICGFSDITIFHNQVHQLGVQSLHCLMPINVKTHHTKETPWLKAMFDVLLGKTEHATGVSKPEILDLPNDAVLVGGNLAILCSLMGTPYDIETRDKVLYIEDVGEHLYKVDRMMHSLALAGKLTHIKALLVGSFTEMEDGKRPFGKTVEEIIREHASSYSYPVIFGVESGHQEKNYPIVFGASLKKE